MEWQDQAIILSVRQHGESSVVLELLTEKHGRHSGLVRGGRSKRNRPVLQVGNHVNAVWRARLAEHLGYYSIELLKAHAAMLMEDRIALSGISSLCSLAHLLPERDPHPGLFEACLLILEYIEHPEIWPGLLVRWEMELLNDLGFQLDLSECAATGVKEELFYVSPKSGKAVSKAAGEPYKEKLLGIPPFLREAITNTPSYNEIKQGFDLTGYFLEKNVLHPRNMIIPEARKRLLSYLSD